MVDPIDSTIIAMWASGATAGQIAKTIGYGRNMVSAKINGFIQSGDITKSIKQARMVAINNRIQELELVRAGANFAQMASIGFTAKRVKFLNLNHDSCRFIIEGSGMKGSIYCGNTKFKQSYCEHHYNLCYLPRPSKGEVK